MPADQTVRTPLRSRTWTCLPASCSVLGSEREDAIVGDIAIPGDFALFGAEAFPGKVLWQGQQPLVPEANGSGENDDDDNTYQSNPERKMGERAFKTSFEYIDKQRKERSYRASNDK